MMLLTYIPTFLESLGMEPSIITLTVTVFMSALVIFPPFLGKYSDKLQNRVYFIYFGSGGMLITLVLLLFNQDLIILNIELFILGFFTSFLTIYVTLYSELVQNDTKWISYFNAIGAIGWFLGVLIGGFLIDAFNIANIFLFTLITYLISVLSAFFIRENRQLILESHKKVTENIEKDILTNPPEQNDQISQSLFYSLFFRNFGIQPILGIIVIIMGIFISNKAEIGFLIGLNPLLQFFLMLLVGKILNQNRIKLFIIIGYILTVIAIFGYMVSINFWSFLIFQIMISLSYSMAWMAINVYIAQNSTLQNKGKYMGYANTSIYAGASIGGLFFSFLLAVFHSNYFISMSFMIIFPIISTLLILFILKIPEKRVIHDSTR
jgi:MFS family permease